MQGLRQSATLSIFQQAAEIVAIGQASGRPIRRPQCLEVARAGVATQAAAGTNESTAPAIKGM